MEPNNNPSEWRDLVETFERAVGYTLCGFNWFCMQGWVRSDAIARAFGFGMIAAYIVWVALDIRYYNRGEGGIVEHFFPPKEEP